jgi:lipid-binding SYLF domain-containing protein
MNWKRFLTVTAVAGLLLSLAAPFARAGAESDKVAASLEVLRDITRIPEKGLPEALLSNAHAIAIIPDVLKVGFVVGGKYGTGIVMVHKNDGTWSNPAFVSLVGGSFGWQIGAEATDLILVFKSKKSIEGIINGKFTFGADASVAAGPVGRSASASTDVLLKAEIISYSRSRGVFAGVSLGGAALQIDEENNAAFYNKPGVGANDILYGEPKSPSGTVWKIKALLTEYSKPPVK